MDSDQKSEVVNPATEEVIAFSPSASAVQVNEAVLAAQTAFTDWSTTTTEYRRGCLNVLADLVLEQREELQLLEMLEKGSNFPSIPVAAANVRAIAGLYDFPDEVLMESEDRRVTLSRRPLGVVAAIAPW